MYSASVRRCFFFSSRRRHTISTRDWSSDVCSSDLVLEGGNGRGSQVPVPAVDRPETIDNGLGVLGKGALEPTDPVRQRGHALLSAPLDGFEGAGDSVELDRQRLLEGRLLALQQLDAVLE